VFEALGMAGSGMGVHKTWMDAISDNIANVSTVRRTSEAAFQSRYIVATNQASGGAQVAGVALSSAVGKLAYDPSHPLADADGLVRMPDVDLGEQLTTAIMAQRGYQANISQLDRVKAAYQAAIQMGRV
jgi:flagellar basal-body rod protein FlgC